jgi:hypothetical protein
MQTLPYNYEKPQIKPNKSKLWNILDAEEDICLRVETHVRICDINGRNVFEVLYTDTLLQPQGMQKQRLLFFQGLLQRCNLANNIGGGGGAKSTMSIRNFNLRRSQGRKRGTIRLNQSLMYIHPLLHSYPL